MDIFGNVPQSLRVWSLDGGGKGALSQLIIIHRMMRLIQHKHQSDEVPRPCSHADVMIGTGLGGAAAVMMGRLRLSASETYDEIVRLGQNIFGAATKTKPYFSLPILKLSISSMLERRGYKSDEMMVESPRPTKQCHVIILASSKVNITGYKCLRTYSTSTNINCTIVDAIAATMAIPDWFEAVIVGAGLEKQILIGGCLGYNNPTWEGLLEVKEIFGVDARLTSLISIGSGKTTSGTPATNHDANGSVEQISADCEQTAVRLSGYFRNVPAYLRVSADTLVGNADLSNWDENYNIIMNGRATSYLERVEIQRDLDRAVTNLLQDTGMITLGQLTQATATRISARSAPRLTPYYVPRPEVYHIMEKCLAVDDMESQKMLIMHGMGGSGKTQSASFFERRNRKRYKHVFFIDASSVTSIKADLQSAIRSLGGAHSQDTYENALQYLKGTESGHWLVIFDNADDPNLPLVGFIPSCDHGHVIITTRNPDVALLAPSSHLRMPTMEDSEALAVLFLAAQSPRPESQADNKDALEICRLVGNLPLALVQVGCYCFASQVSFAHYLERFREHRQRLMELRPSWRSDEYAHSAYTSISLSYSLLEDDVKFLLHLLAFFHPSGIHLDILRISAKHHFDITPSLRLLTKSEQQEGRLKDLNNILLADGKWNQTRMDALLMGLQSLSLVSLAREDDSTIATIHPLVQSFAQDILTTDDFNRFLYMATRMLCGCVWEEHENLFRHLPPHIFELENHKMDLHLNDAAAFAFLFSDLTFYADALKRWLKVKFSCNELLGSGHSSTLVVAVFISTCLRQLGEYDASIAEITSAIAIQERNMGRDHHKTVNFYLKLAILLEHQGKLQEAESILQTNLEILQSRHGKEHRDTLITTSRLGLNLYEQGRFHEAETTLNGVVPATVRVFGSDSLNASRAIGRLCRVLMKLGQWTEAETRLQQQLPWRLKTYGREDPFTLVVLRDLALCSRHRGDLKEAERLQGFVLEVTKKQRGDRHRDTIEAQNALEETLQLIDQKGSRAADADVNRTRNWKWSKVDLFLLFSLVAFAAASAPRLQSWWSYVKYD